jgi:hypothetical protein
LLPNRHAELSLGAVWAVGHRLADVGEQDAPGFVGSTRAPAVGAGEVESDCLCSGIEDLGRTD